MALFRQGTLAAATEHFQQAIEGNRGFTPAFYMLGETYRKLGEPSAAISAYTQALQLSPQDADAYVHLAECNMQLDLLDAAREAVEQGVGHQSGKS